MENQWGLNYYFTQLLTGHDSFYTFLDRIGRAENAVCVHCGTEAIDPPEHTLLEYPACYSQGRDLLCVCSVASLDGVIGAAVANREAWLAFNRLHA